MKNETGCELRGVGCGQKELKAWGIAHRVRHRSMEGAGGTKGLYELAIHAI